MKKKQIILTLCALVCMALLVAAVGVMFPEEEVGGGASESTQSERGATTPVSFAKAKESFAKDIQALKEGTFENLKYNEFVGSLETIEGLYNLEVYKDVSYKERSNLENFAIMKTAIDSFFMEDFDRSFIMAEFYINDEVKKVRFDDVETVCTDEIYKQASLEYLFGQDSENSKYMVQTSASLLNTWFSKYGLGTVMPGDFVKSYPYIAGIRQNEDVVLHLKDGDITLSDMEVKVMDYIENGFPLPTSEGVSYQIAEANITENGEYDCVNYSLRRVYKGIPFEHGAFTTGGMYSDEVDHERGQLAYLESSSPDSMAGFGFVNGAVVQTQEISDIIPLSGALQLLSDKLGENSIYDVYGVEIVYRNTLEKDEIPEGLENKLVPQWKIITINQNDDKYTLFYVDVVTGEITERFEYYYGE